MKMLATYLVVIFLPLYAYSRITINIHLQRFDNHVTFNGREKDVIEDDERNTFKVDNSSLISASGKYKDKACDKVFVKDPTPYGKVYILNDWDPVYRYIEAVKVKIINVTTEEVTIGTSNFTNNHDSDATYNTTVTHDGEESMTHSWGGGKPLNVQHAINYLVNFPPGASGPTSTFFYKSHWNKTSTQTRAIKFGSTSAVQIVVSPGGKVTATLNATRGIIKVEVDYEAYIAGDVFCYYEKEYQGHKFWAYSIVRLQKAGSLPRVMKYKETFTLHYFVGARLTVTNSTDDSNNEILDEVNAGIIETDLHIKN